MGDQQTPKQHGNPVSAPPPEYYQPPPAQGQQPAYNQQYPPPGYQPHPDHQQPPGNSYNNRVYPGAQPMQPAYSHHSNTVVITTQPVAGYTRQAQAMTCPLCQAQIVTSVDYESGTGTFLLAGVICFVGCALGCCLIPFCCDSMKDAIHTCPNCRKTLGRKGLL